MEQVTHDGRRTAYRHVRPDGDGPTVLYVHGSGGTHRLWNGQYGPGGELHPAVAIDLSGHGESEDVETAPGQPTLAAYVEDVVAVARETDAHVLVGNSLGGAVILELLRSAAYEPRAVVLAGTGAKLAVGESVRELASEDFEGLLELLHSEGLLLADADEETIERSKGQMRATGQSIVERDFLTCHRFDLRDSLGSMDTPALALVGEADRLTPPKYHDYLAAEMGNCEVVRLADAAHLAMLDRPAAFNAALGSFCTRCLE